MIISIGEPRTYQLIKTDDPRKYYRREDTGRWEIAEYWGWGKVCAHKTALLEEEYHQMTASPPTPRAQDPVSHEEIVQRAMYHPIIRAALQFHTETGLTMEQALRVMVKHLADYNAKLLQENVRLREHMCPVCVAEDSTTDLPCGGHG